MSDMRLDNDGQDFLCMDCGTTVPRSRSNPYPSHECPTPAPRQEAEPYTRETLPTRQAPNHLNKD